MNRRDAIRVLGGLAIATGPLASHRAWAQDNSPIRLGLITSLSGPAASGGQPMQLGVQIAVDQINQAGGVNGRQLELLVRDDKAKPTDGAIVTRELTGEGVNLLLGVASSSVALGISAMLEQENALLISCAAHSEKLTKENFVRNYFRVTDNPYMRMRAMAKMAAERYPQITSWGSVIPDHEYGRTTWGCFQDGLLEFYPGLASAAPSISQPVLTSYGAADYRTAITQAMSLPAEGFLVAVYGSDAVTYFKQAEPYGFFQKAKLIFDPANETIVARAMRQSLPEMWVGAHWSAPAFEDVAVSRELQAEAVRRTNDPLTTGFMAEGHAAVMAYAAAVQAAGTTDTQAVRGALENVTFGTATGPRRFRKEDHQAVKPVVISRMRGSSTASQGFEIVETILIDGADVIDPPTPGQPLQLRKA